MNDIQTILFVELLGGIGDVVIALPAIHALARSHSTAHLTVLTFAPGGGLLESDPHIQRVVYAGRENPRRSLEELLAQTEFDLIVSDTNYDGIAELIEQTNVKHTLTNLWQSPPNDERVGDRFIKLLWQHQLIHSNQPNSIYPQIYLTTQECIEARQFLSAAFRPLVILISDAGMSIKKWSTESFIEIGMALNQTYSGTILVTIGANLEDAIVIQTGIGQNAQRLPKLPLRQLSAILAEADLAIAADTGLARIAAALQVPTITLFGPSWYERYGQPTPHINLQGFPQCPERNIQNFTEQACWYSGECPYEWRSCLDDITPETVLDAAVTLLDRGVESGEWGVGKAIYDYPRETARTVGAVLHACPERRTESVGVVFHACPQSENLSQPQLDPAWQNVRNLLVMRLDNIGDVIMVSPAFRSLKENLPDAKITLMASPAGALTAPLLPGIDHVLPWRVLWQDLGRLNFDPTREWQLIETLRQHQFDAAIIFTSFAQSPHPAALICNLAGIGLRLGESKEQDFSLTHAIPPAPDDIHQVDRNLRLIESVGFQVRDRRLTLTIPANPNPITKPYFVLNPWTSCQSRNYDPIRFAHAARQLNNITGWEVVVTGVEKDRDRAHPLLEILGDCAIDLIGKTTLSELVSLVANAKLILTNNTSTMHIADATQTPNVVMFAGTEKECQWQPRHSLSRLLRRPTVCSPCYAFTCPYELQCLDISVETVVEAALDLLEIPVSSVGANRCGCPQFPDG